MLCSHSPNDATPTPESQRKVSIAAVRGAVRPPKYHIIHFKVRFKPTDFMSELFEDQNIEHVTWSKCEIFFSKQFPYKLFS